MKNFDKVIAVDAVKVVTKVKVIRKTEIYEQERKKGSNSLD